MSVNAPIVLVMTAVAFLGAPFRGEAQGVEVSDAQTRAVVDRETGAVLDTLFAAFSARDADRGNALYAQGPNVLHVSGTNVIQVDTITPYTRAAFAALDSASIRWTPNRLSVLSADVAVRTINVTFSLHPHGARAQRSSGVQTLVFKKVDGVWRIVHDQRTLTPT